MGKKRISIEHISHNPEVTHALVVVWEQQKVEGKMQEQPIGEDSISFPTSLTPEEIIVKVKETAKQIISQNAEAKAIRTKLNKLLQKESVE